MRTDKNRVTAAAVYARISQDRGGAGLGVQRQAEDCAALADRLGWRVVETFTDNDISAYSGKKRPGYERLLEGLRDGSYGAVLAWHPDRLHRSPAELETFIDLVESVGAQVATVQGGEYDLSTASGRMTARIVGAVARHESEHKSERIRRKHRQIAEAGGVGGGGRPAYGFLEDRITHDPVQAALVREAAALVLAGGSLRQASLKLGLTRAGTKRLLTSYRVAGIREHHGRLYPAQWAPIISADDRLRLSALLNRHAAQRGPDPRYLLSGLLVCGKCGATLTATSQKRANGASVRRYACPAPPNGCRGNGLLAEPTEALVASEFESFLQGVEVPAPVGIFADAARILGAAFGRSVAATGPDPVQELADIEERRALLAEMFAAGDIDGTEWKAARNALDARQREAEESVTPEVGAPWQPVEEWLAADAPERNRILRAYGVRLRVEPTTKGGNRFDPGRVSLIPGE